MNAHELRKLIEIAEKYGNLNDPIITVSSSEAIYFDLPIKDALSAEDMDTLENIGLFWSEYDDCWVLWT